MSVFSARPEKIFCSEVYMNDQRKTEKEYTEGIKVNGGFFGWLENFWYHYKWHFIGITAALVVLFVCTLQMCSKEKNDIVIVYSGSAYLTETEVEELEGLMEVVIPADHDGDGEKNVAFKNFLIWSEDQIKDIESNTDTDGHRYNVDKSYITAQNKSYEQYLLTGESSVYLLEGWLYESLKSGDRLLTLDTLGEEYAALSEDGYGILIGDLTLYENYGVFKILPEDTVLCIMKPYVMGKSSNEKDYAFEKEMFMAIAGYNEED